MPRALRPPRRRPARLRATCPRPRRPRRRGRAASRGPRPSGAADPARAAERNRGHGSLPWMKDERHEDARRRAIALAVIEGRWHRRVLRLVRPAKQVVSVRHVDVSLRGFDRLAGVNSDSHVDWLVRPFGRCGSCCHRARPSAAHRRGDGVEDAADACHPRIRPTRRRASRRSSCIHGGRRTERRV
jgi:hypothetical protein